jgi:phosphonate transport system substrate-binding protein
MSSIQIRGIIAARPLLAAMAALLLAACAREQAPVVIAAPPGEDAAAQTAAWAPFLADMEKAVGRKTQAFFAGTDTARVDAMRFRQADIGWFDNASGMEAVRRANAEVFARAEQADGSDAYRVALLTKKGSGVTLDKVLACDRRLTLGLGENPSTVESQALLTWLFDPRGQTPQACFKSVREAKAEANIYAVNAGVLDTAGAATTAMTKVAESERDALSGVDTIWTSPLIPDSPLMWRKDLDAKLKAKISRFLLDYGKGDGARAARERAVLKGLGLRGFARADDSHFLAPREMAAAARLRRARARHDAAGAKAAEADLAALTAERAAKGL